MKLPPTLTETVPLPALKVPLLVQLPLTVIERLPLTVRIPPALMVRLSRLFVLVFSVTLCPFKINTSSALVGTRPQDQVPTTVQLVLPVELQVSAQTGLTGNANTAASITTSATPTRNSFSFIRSPSTCSLACNGTGYNDRLGLNAKYAKHGSAGLRVVG